MKTKEWKIAHKHDDLDNELRRERLNKRFSKIFRPIREDRKDVMLEAAERFVKLLEEEGEEIDRDSLTPVD